MNARERFVGALTFEDIDRVPLMTGGPRESTLRRWHSEGLSSDEHFMEAANRILGIEPEQTQAHVWPGVNFRMVPQFEEKVPLLAILNSKSFSFGSYPSRLAMSTMMPLMPRWSVDLS